jgi:hypothetical protein
MNSSSEINRIFFIKASSSEIFKTDEEMLKELSSIKDTKFEMYIPPSREELSATWLYEQGITDILDPFEEYFGKPDNRETKISILQKYLDKVITDKQLIIIDPYFFNSSNPAMDLEYKDFFIDLIKKYLPVIDTLLFVTSKTDDLLRESITSEIFNFNRKITIEFAKTNDFHDRYWISGLDKDGLLMGTSLNGIGSRYSLIDYLKSDDVKDIVKLLKEKKFIN